MSKKTQKGVIQKPACTLEIPQGASIVACKVFAPELETLGIDTDRVRYLDQGLHRYPKELRAELGAALDEIERISEAESVILIYGYCGGGLEGLMSKKLPITAPLVHDCIPLLLGCNPSEADGAAISTFFLSAGWIEYGETPLSEYRKSAERLGRDDALWAAREMTKSYRKVSLIENGAPLTQRHRDHARDTAELLGLECCNLTGNLGRLTDLVQRRLNKRIITIRPGVELRKAMYFQVGSCPFVDEALV